LHEDSSSLWYILTLSFLLAVVSTDFSWFLASQAENEEIVALLLAKGADQSIKDGDGSIAFDMTESEAIKALMLEVSSKKGKDKEPEKK